MANDMEDYMNKNFRIQRPGEEFTGPTWRDTKMVEPQNAHENIDTLIEVDDNKDYTDTNVEDFTIQKIMYQSDFNGDGLVMDKDTHMVKKLN